METARGLSDAFVPTEAITHSHEYVATYTWVALALAARQAEALARAVPGAEDAIVSASLP